MSRIDMTNRIGAAHLSNPFGDISRTAPPSEFCGSVTLLRTSVGFRVRRVNDSLPFTPLAQNEL